MFHMVQTSFPPKLILTYLSSSIGENVNIEKIRAVPIFLKCDFWNY